MDEVSFVLMEVDTILRVDIGRDVAPGGFLHIVIRREVLEDTVSIHREVRMPVHHVRPRSEDVGESDRDEEDEEPEDMFFHNLILLDNLNFSIISRVQVS